jgi:hypothetical protein
MNLPSSLALPRSNFFRSRIGILVLALVAALMGGGLYFGLRQMAPLKLPTAATSPAAQTPVRPSPPAPPPVVAKVYGPPPPEAIWKPPVSPLPGAATLATKPGVVPVPGAVPVAGVPVGAAAIPGAPGTTVPVGTAVGSTETPKSLDASVLFARDQYTYTSGGRRDPFLSLLDGKFQGSGDGGLVDVGDIHLVGIMWGASDKFALVEDSRGHGYVLRVGDPVVNGYISGISKTELQIVQNAFGESQSMSIKLKPKEGDQNATRN